MTNLQGIGYALWWRSRWGMAVAISFVLLFSLLMRTLGTEHLNWIVAVCGSIGSVAAILVLIGIFLYQDADVAVKGSAYPSYMLTLPVRTGALTLFPMVTGTVIMLLATIPLNLVAQLQSSSPVFWPAFMVTTLLALLQAIFWFPFGIPYSKLILTIAALIGCSIFVGVSIDQQVPDLIICRNFIFVILASYAFAFVGVSRARRGEEWIKRKAAAPATTETVTRKPAKDRPPFPSAKIAQQWYEWRQHGTVLPIFAIILFIAFAIPLQWNTTYSPVTSMGSAMQGYNLALPTYANTYFPAMLSMMLFVAWAVGCGARRSDSKYGDRTLRLFFGVRPMSDEGIFSQKLATAAKSTVIAWAVLLVSCLLLSNMKGAYLPMNPENFTPNFVQKPFFAAIAPLLTPQIVLKGFLILALLMIGTWRNYIVGFWSEISGSSTLYYGYPLACITAAFLIPTVTSSWLWLRSYLADAEHWIWILWTIFAIRVIIAAVLTIRLRRRQAISSGFIGRYLASVVLLIGATICAVVYLTMPFISLLSSSYSLSDGKILALIIGFVVLWTPFVRILLGVHFLNVNRHRAN